MAQAKDIRNNIMVHVRNLTDAALSIFENRSGKIISVGSNESYVKFHIEGKTLIEFIPNSNMKVFAEYLQKN